MDLGPHENPLFPQPYRLGFTTEESQAVSAAYRERVNKKLLAGAVDEITLFEARVATWGADQTGEIFLKTVAGVVKVLKDFAETTTEETRHLAEQPEPAYSNIHPSRRYVLGAKAGELATDLEEIGQTRADASDQDSPKALNRPTE